MLVLQIINSRPARVTKTMSNLCLGTAGAAHLTLALLTFWLSTEYGWGTKVPQAIIHWDNQFFVFLWLADNNTSWQVTNTSEPYVQEHKIIALIVSSLLKLNDCSLYYLMWIRWQVQLVFIQLFNAFYAQRFGVIFASCFATFGAVYRCILVICSWT